jgi:hypothetical protein
MATGKERNPERTEQVRKAFGLPEDTDMWSTTAATWIKGTEMMLPAPAIISTKRGSYWVKLDAELPSQSVAKEQETETPPAE